MAGWATDRLRLASTLCPKKLEIQASSVTESVLH